MHKLTNSKNAISSEGSLKLQSGVFSYHDKNIYCVYYICLQPHQTYFSLSCFIICSPRLILINYKLKDKKLVQYLQYKIKILVSYFFKNTRNVV